jgi:phosphoglycerate dehydrogenase-like enzyme
MSRPKVLFVGESENLPLAFPEDLRKRIALRADIIPGEFLRDEWSAHRDALKQADFILATWGMPNMDSEFLSAAPHLRAVFYAAGSIKPFATEESYARGIMISSAWEANAIPVAEFTHALITLSLKQFWQFTRQPPAKRFDRGDTIISGNYRGSTVGLLSLGAIGRGVASRLAQSNEVNVIAYDPYADADQAEKLGVTLVPLEELFSRSDVVSIHSPWLVETENLVNGKLISLMKRGASLINTSRGALINEVELVEVLRQRPDLTALLDVTHPEPPEADSPLRTLDNLILTPHIAGSLGQEITRMGLWMVEEFERFLDGQPLKNSVTLEMLARMA